jgi:hypothetical protein
MVHGSATGACLVYTAKEKRLRAQTACTGGDRFHVASQEWNEELARCLVRSCASIWGWLTALDLRVRDRVNPTLAFALDAVHCHAPDHQREDVLIMRDDKACVHR